MSRYEGLDPRLRKEVLDRDSHRCRWCGRTNWGVDLHHIRYRRGKSDDVKENLISLCRRCHGFAHGVVANAAGEHITKKVAQMILRELTEQLGVTGLSLWRQRKAQWTREGRCKHGEELDACLDCSSPLT